MFEEKDYSDDAFQGKEIYERLLTIRACRIGSGGYCCKLCFMGPCRLFQSKEKSLCGAGSDLIISRNILRFVAGGTSAHCGHTHHLLDFLKKDYSKNYIKKKAPKYLYSLWEKIGLKIPKNLNEAFTEISEAYHLTTMGVNSDYKEILKEALKLGIIDGYYGLYLATELEDRHFGKPNKKESLLDLNCIDPNKVNIAIHGHEPMLAEYLVKESKNYDNLNLIGVCCTGAGLLSKHGIPLAAHFLLQEDIIMTGLIDALVVDIQCVMPSVEALCECYHTKLISTNEIGRIPNAIHLPVTNKTQAKKHAKEIIDLAVHNNRFRMQGAEKDFETKSKSPKKVVVGFHEDDFDEKAIAENLKNGSIKGIIGVVGCVNPRCDRPKWVETFKKLSKDYLILTTGCMAFEFGNHELMDGENFFHLGSCVNNARIAEIFRKVADYSKKEIAEMPFLVSAPMPITEKSMAIAMFFAAIGCSIHSGVKAFFDNHRISSFIAYTLKFLFNSKVFIEEDPDAFYESVISKIK